MNERTAQNKRAWEFNAYAFWVSQSGTPEVRAERDRENPRAMLKKYAQYFEQPRGQKIANICGSCGKKAVPLALLGARVTVFDLSEDNRRYALETARAAGVPLEYVVGDVLETDLKQYGGAFDVVFMEGGVLHYFPDLQKFMGVMYALLREGGRMICSDFHPFQKILDVQGLEQPTMSYFSTEIIQGEMAHARFYPPEIRSQIPLCSYRKYTVSEIINATLSAGFVLRQFDEHPSWTDESKPGEFTLLADRTM